MDDDLVDPVHDAVMPLLDQSGVGIGVALVKDGTLVFSGGYGWANLSENRPLTSDTPMMVASVSKTLIGVAAMQAVERDGLDLLTPVAELVGFPVENPRYPQSAITLEHLLTHTSGIEDSRIYEDSYASGDSPIALGEFVQGYVTEDSEYYHRKNFADRPPGEFSYSNVAISLGAYALGRYAEMEYKDLVKRDIFDPLGMENSAFTLAELNAEPATQYHASNRPYVDYGFPTYPDGLLRTSPTDLGRFLAAIQGGGMREGGQILSPQSVNALLTVDESIGSDASGQALVWARIELNTGRMLMGHTGGDYGVGAFMGLDLEADVGALFVANQVDFDIEELIDAYDALFEIAKTADVE